MPEFIDNKNLINNLINKSIEDKKSINISNLTVDDSKYIIAASFIENINWISIALFDTSEILSAKNFYPVFYVAVSALFLLIIVIIFFVNRIIIKRISKLNLSSKKIADGDYDIEIDISGNDEIEGLSKKMVFMAKRIKEYTDDLELKVKQRTGELTNAYNKISEYNKMINESLEYAEKIQNAILPKENFLNKIVRNYFLIYYPREIVGGDFYYFNRKNDKIIIGLIDCTGHGVPGALMTMIVKSALDIILEKTEVISTDIILNELNIMVKKFLNKYDKHKYIYDDGLDIGICLYDEKSKKMEFSGAGVDLYHSGNNGVVRIRSDKHSLGYYKSQDDYKYNKYILDVLSTDIFYIFSDGFIDQNPEDNAIGFGFSKVINMLNDLRNYPYSKHKDRIIKNFNDFKKNQKQRDDITVISFQF